MGIEEEQLRTGTSVWRGLGWYPALWAALSVVTAFIIIDPNFPVAVPSPRVSIGLATLAGATGLSVLYLGALRFSVFGSPADLLVGLAFGILGFSDLVFWVVNSLIGLPPGPTTWWLWPTLAVQAVSAVLLLAATLGAPERLRSDQRRAPPRPAPPAGAAARSRG